MAVVTAIDIQAAAESVAALSAFIVVVTWTVHMSRRALKWHQRRRRDYVLGIVIPACFITLVLAWITKGGDRG